MRPRPECFGLPHVEYVPEGCLHAWLACSILALLFLFMLYSGSGPRCAFALLHGGPDPGPRTSAASYKIHIHAYIHIHT